MNENKPKLKYSEFHKDGIVKIHYTCLNHILEICNKMENKK